MRFCIILLLLATALRVTGCKNPEVLIASDAGLHNTVETPPPSMGSGLTVIPEHAWDTQTDEPAQTSTEDLSPTVSTNDFAWWIECGDLVNEAYKGVFGDAFRITYYGAPGYTDVIEALGEPTQTVEYTGFVRMYFAQGVEIDYITMSGAREIENYIYLSPESTLEIGRGIGIGSTREEIVAAYDTEVNLNQSTGGLVVIGRYHKGIILVIRNDIVSSIYISTGGGTEEYFLENINTLKPPDNRG